MSVLPEKLQSWLDNFQQKFGHSVDDCERALQLILKEGHEQADEILQRLQLMSLLSADETTVCCAILSPLLEDINADSLSTRFKQFPQPVQLQLQQLHKLQTYEATVDADTAKRAESLRRLLLALAHDVRVVLVALVNQLLNLRAAMSANRGAQKKLAEETRLIHAPLANRLGIWQIKWELEDIAFRFAEPDTYSRISKLIAERRSEREAFIKQFITDLTRRLKEVGIDAQVSGRPKHIFSIWRKMQRKNLGFDELYDIRAVRVLVNEVHDCYTVLGLAHMHWTPVPGEFDDYIRVPKGNNYQSLHTAVSDDKGRVLEVQIRTHQMHQHAELGVAAHWRYKEGGPGDESFERKILVMRQLLEAGEDALDDQSLLDSFHNLTTDDRIYVLTPRGEVMDMAQGSTVLDFAYQVHTNVGHRCRGAKVDGRIVQLTHALSTGERVEILTGKQSKPSRDWLKKEYLHNARSRNKVRQWFRQADYEQNHRAGKEALEAELSRTGLDHHDLPEVLKQFHAKDVDALMAMIGAGEFTTVQVAGALARHTGSLQNQPNILVRRRTQSKRKPKSSNIQIEGVGNLLHQMAKCCQPLPGDPITGYITQTRGVSIHRQDCPSVLRLAKQSPDRIMLVNWGNQSGSEYQVKVQILAYDRKTLLKDISAVIASEDLSVAEMHTSETSDDDVRQMQLTIRVREFSQLSELLSKLQAIPNIIKAARVKS